MDDAWDAVKAADMPDLRGQLRTNEKLARTVIAGGSVSSVGQNRRTTEFAAYGPGQVTPAEVVEMWRALIDLYDSSRKWLTDCANIGLDPNVAELQGFPDPAPPAVQNPTAIEDLDVYNWMMAHCIAISSVRSDYSELRINTGAQYV